MPSGSNALTFFLFDGSGTGLPLGGITNLKLLAMLLHPRPSKMPTSSRASYSVMVISPRIQSASSTALLGERTGTAQSSKVVSSSQIRGKPQVNKQTDQAMPTFALGKFQVVAVLVNQRADTRKGHLLHQIPDAAPLADLRRSANKLPVGIRKRRNLRIGVLGNLGLTASI